MVRPTVSPVQARVLGAVLGVTGFAFASISGMAGLTASASDWVHPGQDKIWITEKGDKNAPPQGRIATLDCGDLSLWGNKLDKHEGTFHIVSDDPSGHDETIVKDQDWKFAKDSDQLQVVATIDGKELINKAEDHGDKAADGRFRFDVFFDQQPHQHIYFWVKDNCHEGGGDNGGGGESNPTPVVQQPAPPAPVVAGTSTSQAPKAVAAVPQTGADAPFLTGMMLMSAGGGALGFARRLGRRRGR
ncbi:MAG: hypothetical protein QOG45_1072 [Chloroflexota bacterium]|nr:hypothetical protein [Chloroflexota bacterium]